MKEIFVFGHRNPDTDSVCSAIALAHLKQVQGLNAVPKILSDINKESKFALDYFSFKKPEFINDVKVKIKDINYEKGAFIYEDESIDKSFDLMAKYSLTAMPLVDKKNILTGFLTLKDVAKFLANFDEDKLNTNLTNLVKSLNASVITYFDDIIKGRIIVAGVGEETFLNEVKLTKETVLIVGNRESIIKRAINEKIKLIIISCDQEIDSKLIEKAVLNEVTIIKTKLTTFNITNKINLSNISKSININSDPVVLKEDDYYTEFLDLVKKSKHTNYPVLNKKNKCLGLIKITGDNNYEKQEVILVDHNSLAQSAVGLEEATILEIVDHHNLGAMNTILPISFRSMPVGCTSTIIFKMYNESKIDIPKDIAGLMLSAIISDTLLFTSPTTTSDDKIAAIKLSQIAGVNMEEYGKSLLKAASSIEGMSIKDLVYTDYKSYTLKEKQIGISVITTMDFDSITPKIDEIRELLNTKIEQGYDLSVMFATDVIKNGSYLIYNEEAEELLKESFNLKEIYQGIFIKDLVSRKQQMLPNILENL